MMNEHSQRQFVSPHFFQAPEPFITRNMARLSHYPSSLYIPLTDNEILERVLSTITDNQSSRSASTNDIRERASPPMIVAPSMSTGDIPERVSSPVIPCYSIVDGEGHEEGDSKEDNKNTPLSQNDETDEQTTSRPEKHSSEMRKEGTCSIKPVTEEMEEDLYCVTDLGLHNASQQERPEASMGKPSPSPDLLSSVEMIVLPPEEALKMSYLQIGQSPDTQTKSDQQYEDVTDEESPQMDVNPVSRGENLLKSCEAPIFVETDDGDFEYQPCTRCAACVRRLQETKKDTTDTPSVSGVNCNPATVNADEMRDRLKPQPHEELMEDESPAVNAHEDYFYEWGNETEDELEDYDFNVTGPIGISSLKYIPPEVWSKSAPASSQLEVFDDMVSFKEAKAKQLGIAPDGIHDCEVDQSNTGTAAPIAPARSRLSFRAAPQRSPLHSTENGSDYAMPPNPVSIVNAMDSSSDDDFCERKDDGRKVKRRKLSKSKNSEYSKSKAETDQPNSMPADCQRRPLISSENERERHTPQSSSSETEHSSDCSKSPPQRNRITVPKQCWDERSNSPSLYRSVSNSESGVHDNSDTASSSLRRSMSHEPEDKESQKIKTTILKTSKNVSEKKKAKNGDYKEKQEDSGGSRPEARALRPFKSREVSSSKEHFSESTLNSDRAKEKPLNSRQSSAVTKANVLKPREGLPVSGAPGTTGRQKVQSEMSRLYTPGQTGKWTCLLMDEEMSRPRTLPVQRRNSYESAPGQKRNSYESAPGQKRNSYESAPGQKRIAHESAPRQRRNSQESAPGQRSNLHGSASRQRHKSHESAHPLRRKTIEEARGETARKSTPIHPAEQSASSFANYKWKERKNKNLPKGRYNRGESPTELDWSD